MSKKSKLVDSYPMTSIIMATLNEVESLPDMIKGLFEYIPAPVEIIVVDDNSTDGTWQMIEEMNDPRVILVRRKQARGLASATLRGVIEAHGDIIGWIDADAWMLPPKLPIMIESLKEHDIVVASRFVEGGGDDRQPARKFASIVLNRFAQIVLGPAIRDYTSNFVVLRRTVLDEVIPTAHGFGEFFVEFIFRCHRLGFSIHEIPYHLKDRAKGESKALSSWLSFFRMGLQYVRRILYLKFMNPYS